MVHRRPNSGISAVVSIFSAWTLLTAIERSLWIASLTKLAVASYGICRVSLPLKGLMILNDP